MRSNRQSISGAFTTVLKAYKNNRGVLPIHFWCWDFYFICHIIFALSHCFSPEGSGVSVGKRGFVFILLNLIESKNLDIAMIWPTALTSCNLGSTTFVKRTVRKRRVGLPYNVQGRILLLLQCPFSVDLVAFRELLPYKWSPFSELVSTSILPSPLIGSEWLILFCIWSPFESSSRPSGSAFVVLDATPRPDSSSLTSSIWRVCFAMTWSFSAIVGWTHDVSSSVSNSCCSSSAFDRRRCLIEFSNLSTSWYRDGTESCRSVDVYVAGQVMLVRQRSRGTDRRLSKFKYWAAASRPTLAPKKTTFHRPRFLAQKVSLASVPLGCGSPRRHQTCAAEVSFTGP